MKIKDFSFRLWDYENDCYYDPWINNRQFEDVVFDINGDDGYEIEIWTGIRDRNDKKIYENDILEVEFNWGREYDYETLVYRAVVQTNDFTQVQIRNSINLPISPFFLMALECDYNKKVMNIPLTSDFSNFDYIEKRGSKAKEDFLVCEKLKVLGNIHENKELYTKIPFQVN